jgi:hypothetical protein
MKHVAWAIALCACTRTTNLVEALVVDAAIAPDAAKPMFVPDASVALCGNRACACSNGIDDDGDERTDGLDPECSAAFDDDEDSFAVGVHGEDRSAKCQGCFFDGNSGLGECKRAASCAVDGTSDGSPGAACRGCEAGDACRASCLSRVPNGCDCFGCCEIWRDGQRVADVLLSDTCSLRDLDNPAKCERCVPAQDCRNPCGECELCTGRPVTDLPASCGGEGFVCEDAPSCESSAECSDQSYCQLGCCLTLGI